MKILIAASWLKLGGGVTRTLLELLKHIDRPKHSVTLVLMELDKEVLDYLPKDIRIITTKDRFQSAGSSAILKDFLKKKDFSGAASYAAELTKWKVNPDNYRHHKWISSRRNMTLQSPTRC